ncbi:beta-galactosidase family protein [Lactococcus ileimucosae]|uniref:Beta-galactosidase n=1 Tax=Lactococcus ileimucosae TaxID=2941329 RepID=A0ABV4D817_9LACT
MKKQLLKIKGNQFELENESFQFISGAIHYFRMPKETWYHSLYNLKAMGANTVETYIPWNLHEKIEGCFDFENNLDIKAFVETAESLGLYVILRPSPYICAEWEFGGFPGWLLKDRHMNIRSSDSHFIDKVSSYMTRLFQEIVPLQSTKGGPVLMMQLENEYGSFGQDKKYLSILHDMMIELGCDVPIFTADGEWLATQRAGSLTEKNILPTGNFGSKPAEKFKAMTDFHGNGFPLFCMEFWDGWFNRYSEKIIRRDPVELAESVKEALELGSVNLYMFHGGTNFGFMNGCSSRGNIDLPQVTSYDYDAPLDEAGNPTQKFYELQRIIHELYPEIEQKEPLIKKSMSAQAEFVDRVSYFEVKDQISEIVVSPYPMTMEDLDHPYGYVLYEHNYTKDTEEEYFRVIDASDRVHFYLNQEHQTTQYREEIGEKIEVPIVKEANIISVLVENLGRVNYGPRLLSDSQRKGIRSGVMSDLHFISGDWKQYLLLDEKLHQADFNQAFTEKGPSLHKFNLKLDADYEDTYLDLSDFGKGFVTVNGKNIGRFWDRGPFLSLYLPKAFLKSGDNDIIIFETEDKYSEELRMSDKPVYMSEELLMDTIKK